MPISCATQITQMNVLTVEFVPAFFSRPLLSIPEVLEPDPTIQYCLSLITDFSFPFLESSTQKAGVLAWVWRPTRVQSMH